jgi:hypothetical protein
MCFAYQGPAREGEEEAVASTKLMYEYILCSLQVLAVEHGRLAPFFELTERQISQSTSPPHRGGCDPAVCLRISHCGGLVHTRDKFSKEDISQASGPSTFSTSPTFHTASTFSTPFTHSSPGPRINNFITLPAFTSINACSASAKATFFEINFLTSTLPVATNSIAH